MIEWKNEIYPSKLISLIKSLKLILIFDPINLFKTNCITILTNILYNEFSYH